MNLEKLVPTTSLGGEDWLVLVDGGNRENRLNDSSTFEGMEMSRDSFGSLKSQKKFTRPFGFYNIIFFLI